jgi:drug/metabolite transporter (DMT)-like permease
MKNKKVKKSKTSQKEVFGTLLIIFTAIVSGVAIVVNKFFVVKFDPLIFTALRALFIGIVFLLISLYFSKTTKKKFNKVSWKYLILIGIIGGSFAFWIFFTGLKLTTAGRAAFLHKTLPIYAAIFAYFLLREKITKKQLIAMFVMLLGLIVLEFSTFNPDIQLGDALILIATVLWATENTIAKKLMERESNWVITFSRMFFGSLILFGIILLLGKAPLLLQLSLQHWLYIFISGVFLLLYVFTWYWGLKHINLSKASTILLLAPVISLVLGMLWLNEKVFLIQILGSLLILIGALFIVRVKSEKR